MNIKLNRLYPSPLNFKLRLSSAQAVVLILTLILMVVVSWRELTFASPNAFLSESIEACVIASEVKLTDDLRAQLAECLGWQEDVNYPLCMGAYSPIPITPLDNPDEVRILSDSASFNNDKPSVLTGHVEIQQQQKIVSAQTAYVYRDASSGKVTKIEFLGGVRYLEPDRLMIAKRAVINPQDNSGFTEDVLYRFNTDRHAAVLPAWGRAGFVRRFANKDYLLLKTTYTTCAPQDKAWDIKAESITINNAKSQGVAKKAVLRIHEWPILYTPYLSFPTTRERKSGFLMPLVGYSNVGGFDLGLPYYWNMAPNYDATLVPHYYSKRGLMMGGEYRFLMPHSFGTLEGNFLPHDKAYGDFLQNNALEFPRLLDSSTNRWDVGILEHTEFSPNLQLNVAMQQVSDDYYLQDFSTNLAVVTQRQLLRQADLTYTSSHWVVKGMGQSYQTLHPINESPISNVYERLPELMGQGFYYDLPYNAHFNILGQYDQFFWPNEPWGVSTPMPEGPRLHLNPILSLPKYRSWGYITPSAQFVENYYQVQGNNTNFNSDFNRSPPWYSTNYHIMSNGEYNRFIPRYSVDGGLYFERDSRLFGNGFNHLLQPRLFYLYVPYQNQTPIPVYDSGYMIFNTGQLFRMNRFSGFDRIGDTNQLSYALISRWISKETGAELANFTIGQILYFANRKVTLCQSTTGFCIDNPNTFGYLSQDSNLSPIASRLTYFFNPLWAISGDYIWDPATDATNNADLNLHYQPGTRELINFGYSYLVNGDITQVRNNQTQNTSLHQATLAFAWPLTDKWSTVGAYSHNISKNYSMMSLGGLQYDSCCWALRFLAGRTFKSLSASYQPQYNNSVFLQFLFKGLGSVANSDPSTLLNTYLPGYNDLFTQ